MFKRGYAASCGALVLLLTVAQTSPAQVFVTFPVGRQGTMGAFGPTNYSYFPTAFGSPYYGSPYYAPSFDGYNRYNYYSVNPVTPMYYGTAAFAPSYSTAYSYSPPRLVSPSPDLAAKIADSATSAAYSTPNYPLRSPDYNMIYPISPPLSMLANDTAKVEVRVAANAELWFDGHATSQTGTDRSFTTPALEPHQVYEYSVRAQWDANGKPVNQTRKVVVHAGDHVVVDFLGNEAKK